MKIGISLMDPGGPDALRKLTDDVRAAADDGFASAWLSHIFGLDALTALAVAGGAVPGIELGTAVVPTYPRHPAALAQQALTVAQAIGRGRLTLGVGLSHKVVIEGMFGYPFDRPAQHMEEYLSALVPLLHGEHASVQGETVKAEIGLGVEGVAPVPVVVAALGPRMLRLAGERADGTVLWMTGPKTVRDHIAPTITAAAAAAGRPAPRVVCVLPVGVTSDVEAARARADQIFEVYGTLPSYRAMMDREGVAGPGGLAVVGDEDAVAAQIDELRKAGVTDFGAAPFLGGPDAARTRAFLKNLVS
ncbi:TIGR03564 family F420-dependent LLM class oxidoreductase [Actinocorallia sp. API 0066]|uniref:TIGR03564 family F420-dependent LLM class oxidoreductase n=1 Tax=Actinocorallia sp. API 0066 TaxID=2896846 RepID=UPI001E4E8E41|nr:TIGR03564 family F420-dependent LLM class oxidoreductase [Actinocorallia sp. API 0066]MCD0448009.1 TIGR03564 family F420-dependent LLM class oxidoreductase [Actinocorallia sp. API 0066]